MKCKKFKATLTGSEKSLEKKSFNSYTQQYVKNLKASLEILIRRFFSSQEKLSYSKPVLKSPQIKAFISNVFFYSEM